MYILPFRHPCAKFLTTNNLINDFSYQQKSWSLEIETYTTDKRYYIFKLTNTKCIQLQTEPLQFFLSLLKLDKISIRQNDIGLQKTYKRYYSSESKFSAQIIGNTG